jgi:toxin ParE1/3/4
MTRPVLSPQDFDEILDHLTREAGQAVASKYRRALLHLFDLLDDQPALGAPQRKLGRGVRMGVVAPYLVLYRYTGDAVTVLRILHGKRRITPRLL